MNVNAQDHDLKLLVLSDLHLEHRNGFVAPTDSEADVIVLAGDIHVGAFGIEWARATFPNQEIVYVAGNHEFYGHRWDDLIGKMRSEGLKNGVHFLEDSEVTLHGFRFLGSTMWTDFKLYGEENKAMAMLMAKQQINDYRVIAKDGEGIAIAPMDTLKRHEKSYQWMKGALKNCDREKTIVVTHHYPSEQSTAPQWSTSLLSATFGSNLDKLLGQSALWIHGHTHTCFDYVRKGTRVVCNPKGYVFRGRTPENPEFEPNMLVNVKKQIEVPK